MSDVPTLILGYSETDREYEGRVRMFSPTAVFAE
jgi:hypothetical protein